MEKTSDILEWLDGLNAFTDGTHTKLTSGISRRIGNDSGLLRRLQEAVGSSSDNVSELIRLALYPVEKGRCQVCGKPTRFIDFRSGYRKACSKACASKLTAAKGADTKERLYGSRGYNNQAKARETCLKAYGTESFTNPEKRKTTCSEKYGRPWNNDTEKAKATCLERYGVDNPAKAEGTKAKAKATSLSRYGVGHPMQSDAVKGRFKVNCREKTGKDWYLQCPEIRKKCREVDRTRVERFEKENGCIERSKVIEEYGQAWLSLGLPVLKDGKHSFVSLEHLPEIRKCFEASDHGYSSGETEILDFCREILRETAEIQTHVRDVIAAEDGSSLELDIYIPSKGAAIEYNGVYWHSAKGRDYHLSKTLACKEKGIRLLHIWEDLWLTGKPVYKSIIASALGIYERRIPARKCTCRPLASEEYRRFLSENHIQGPVDSSLRLGLFYGSELIQVAGWGESRFRKGEYELHRMCSALNTQVIGGFSKLIAHSGLDGFVSYIDMDLYDGKGYGAVGCRELGATGPGYFYVDRKYRRVNRLSAQKHRLPSLLEKYDPSLNETENMRANGYMKIWNCGNIKVEYRKTVD